MAGASNSGVDKGAISADEAEERESKRVRFESDAVLSSKSNGNNDGTENSAIPSTKLPASSVIELRFVHSCAQIHESGAEVSHDESLCSNPTFLHQIFSADTVYGWQSLRVAIYFCLHSLRSWMHVTGIPDASPAAVRTDAAETIRPFIKAGLCETREELVDAMRDDYVSPFMNLVKTYNVNGNQYGVYKEKLCSSVALKEFHKRMCFLMFIHIDGASFIDDGDPRWEIFGIHQIRNGKAAEFVGYATVYPFASLKEGPQLDFAERIRISQVFILPCFQGDGHGSRLLSAIYDDASKRDAIEVTVEDPSIGFRLLRDITDLRRAYASNILDYELPVEDHDKHKEIIMRLRKELRLTPGQARRCLEVHQLKHVDLANEAEYKPYRLWVKRRLHQDYLEVLDHFEKDRKAKLAEIYDDFEKEYLRAVDRLAKRGHLPSD